MIRVLMPQFRSLKGHQIPGGWVAIVPQFSADADYEAWLVGKVLPEHNHDHAKARADAKARIHAVGQTFYLQSLKLFVSRCADDYAKRFGDLRNPDRTLKGFDPEKLQAVFVPHRKSKGRYGDTGIKGVLVGMAESARRELYNDNEAA